MRHIVVFGFILWVWQALFAGTAQAATAETCSKAQLLAFAPSDDEIKVHRQFAMPVINYPYGTTLDNGWGLAVSVRVDETGRVTCYGLRDEFYHDIVLNDQRRALVTKLASWRYAPFIVDDRPTVAIVWETVREQELPQKQLSLPDASPEKIHIALTRSGCFGTCPAYKVDIYGDGRAVYKGGAYVDVEGEHHYEVPPGQVTQLIDSLRNKNLWSLRQAYRAKITDFPTYRLTMDMDGQTRIIEDYAGQMVGMPSVVTEFEEEVDKVARSDVWIHLSQEGVEHLKSEGFKFRSQAGAALLTRAVANEESHDDEAMLSLIRLGAPVESADSGDPDFHCGHGSMIDQVLRHRRSALIAPIIASGVLKTAGKPDQNKIDAAFCAAIIGGRLAPVQMIWNMSGDRPHPKLTYDDVSNNRERTHKESSVTLLLFHSRYDKSPWQGLEIAKWLIARGCDIKAAAADGTTLLHIAADADDAKFVRYLLDHGMDASTPGRFGLPALGGTQNEDVALMLLEAGTDSSSLNNASQKFSDYAESRHWLRVVAWLKAHRQD